MSSKDLPYLLMGMLTDFPHLFIQPLIQDGDLKATEFLKNTTETSDLKFDQ